MLIRNHVATATISSVSYCGHSHLFSPVNDVLGEGKPAGAGLAHDGVVAGGSVRHLHGAELDELLAQRHAAKQQLPVCGDTRSLCELIHKSLLT